MAFPKGYEYEDALELEILDMEDELDAPLMELDSPQLIEDMPKPTDLEYNTFYRIRISGFDSKSSTAPSVRNDPPDRPVLRLHNAAVAKTAREIVSRTPSGSCVTVLVAGFADPGGESAIGNSIAEQRANAIVNQIRARLPAANRVRATFKIRVVGATLPKRPSTTHQGRALNRRVEVTIGREDCGMRL